MAEAHAQAKYMRFGEAGTAVAFGALAILSIVIAAKAYTPEYAFHAYLFAAASVAAVFAIINRYFDRDNAVPPLTIDGKPNYNMGPVKLATILAVFWGIAGFTVGLWIALELAFPALNFDLSYISFGRLRPLHTSAVIFASAAMCCSPRPCMSCSGPRAHASSAIWRPGSWYSAITSSSSSPAPAICSASPRPRNMPSRNGMRTYGSPSCGSYIC
jgi:hypothetical protein